MVLADVKDELNIDHLQLIHLGSHVTWMLVIEKLRSSAGSWAVTPMEQGGSIPQSRSYYVSSYRPGQQN